MKKRTLGLAAITVVAVFFLFVKRSHYNRAVSYENYNCPDYNIILISIDTVRADRLGCYGYERNTSPNLDRFAEKSIFYENAYSPAPSTIPALRSIMTGCLISNESREDIISYFEKATFLVKILQNKGFVTAAFTDHGGLGKGRQEDRQSSVLTKGFDTFSGLGQGRTAISSHLVTHEAIGWLEGNCKSRFFLWLHYNDPHFNYKALPEYEPLFGFAEGDYGRIYNGIDISEIRKIETNLTTNEIQGLINLYVAEIFYTDEHIAKVLDKIRVLGLEQNSIIIITADHGEEFLERTRVGHEKTVYDELIRVPLMIKVPNHPPARVKDSISTMEIFNFLTDFSLQKFQNFGRWDIFSRTYHYNKKKGKGKPNNFAIISGGYKYIYDSATGREQFYNLEEDIGEKNNLRDDSKHINNVKKLKRKLLTWIAKNCIKVKKPSKEALESQEELDKRLRSLGYVR